MVKEIISIKDFNNEVNESNLAVVDFYATWCGPCKVIAPKIDELSRIYPNVKFIKVDVDKGHEIMALNPVRAMPTFRYFVRGKLVGETVGADINSIKKNIAEFTNSEFDADKHDFIPRKRNEVNPIQMIVIVGMVLFVLYKMFF